MMTCKSAVSLSECARIIMESALTGARVDFKDLEDKQNKKIGRN